MAFTKEALDEILKGYKGEEAILGPEIRIRNARASDTHQRRIRRASSARYEKPWPQAKGIVSLPQLHSAGSYFRQIPAGIHLKSSAKTPQKPRVGNLILQENLQPGAADCGYGTGGMGTLPIPPNRFFSAAPLAVQTPVSNFLAFFLAQNLIVQARYRNRNPLLVVYLIATIPQKGLSGRNFHFFTSGFNIAKTIVCPPIDSIEHTSPDVETLI